MVAKSNDTENEEKPGEEKQLYMVESIDRHSYYFFLNIPVPFSLYHTCWYRYTLCMGKAYTVRLLKPEVTQPFWFFPLWY